MSDKIDLLKIVRGWQNTPGAVIHAALARKADEWEQDRSKSASIGARGSEVSDELPPRWYCVSREGMATLCKDEEDARANARHCDVAWPKGGPHRAVMLGDVAAAVAQAIEACARICDDAAAALLARKRTNDVDRHTASVLHGKAAAIRATIPRTDQEQA